MKSSFFFAAPLYCKNETELLEQEGNHQEGISFLADL